MAEDSGPGWLLNKKTPLWNKLAKEVSLVEQDLFDSSVEQQTSVAASEDSVAEHHSPNSFVEETPELCDREAFVAETQRLATFVELTKSPKLVNQESLVDRSVGEYPLHFVGTTLEKKSKMNAGNTSRSLPKIPTTNSEAMSTEFHPSAPAHVPWNNEQMQDLTRQVAEVLIDTEDRRVEADERRLGIALEAVEEKARERETAMTALLRELVRSNQRANEQAEVAAQRSEESERRREERADKQSRDQERRWKAEKKDRLKREALKSIPPPPAMTQDQDLADFLDMFEDNMVSREIPRAAQAKHLLPLLNTKATIAISGLPAEDKTNIDKLRETLLSTAYDTTKYASKTFWLMPKKAGDIVRATAAKIHRMCKRFAHTESVEKTLEKVSMEKLLQLFPAEVQAHCSDKEPTGLYEMADLIAKFMALQEVEETVYVSDKPWTYKPRAERASAKPHWNGRPFGRSHETPGRAMGGVGGKYTTGGSVEAVTTPTGKQTSLPSGSHPDNTPSTQGTSKEGKGQNRFAASRRCYHCGQYGHFRKDCSRLKQVMTVHVPSLAEVPNDPITVSGSVGEVKVRKMLCDSGATISVIADNLVPQGTVIGEQVSIGTAAGEDPAMYPTALIPTLINDLSVKLYAAIVPAGSMPFPVILGRYIPGAKVTWGLRVETAEGEVVGLEQTTNAQDKSSGKRPSRRKKKFLSTHENTHALQDSQMTEKNKVIETVAEEGVRVEEGPGEAAVGETGSQVLEESTDAAPLSPTGTEIEPGKKEELLAPDHSTPEIPVAAVTTRAQSRRAREQEVADQKATDSSGVVLTPPRVPQETEDIVNDCEDQTNVCEEAATGKGEGVTIRRQDLIEMQQQDPELQGMLQEAEEPDSVFAIRDGILYIRKFLEQDGEAEEDDDVLDLEQWVIVVPESLRKSVLEAGHDHAGHLGARKTKKMVESLFYWPGMASQITKSAEPVLPA